MDALLDTVLIRVTYPSHVSESRITIAARAGAGPRQNMDALLDTVLAHVPPPVPEVPPARVRPRRAPHLVNHVGHGHSRQSRSVTVGHRSTAP